jgi:hypothetical protein
MLDIYIGAGVLRHTRDRLAQMAWNFRHSMTLREE